MHEVSIEMVADGCSDNLIQTLLRDYDAHALELNADMARDAKRWAIWQHAISLVTQH